MRIAEQKCIGSLRARVNGRLIRNTFCIGSEVIRYRVNGVLAFYKTFQCNSVEHNFNFEKYEIKNYIKDFDVIFDFIFSESRKVSNLPPVTIFPYQNLPPILEVLVVARAWQSL